MPPNVPQKTPIYSPEHQAIGERIKARREQLGLTQEQVAAQLGIGRPGYAHYETGRSAVSAVDLHRLSRILHTTLDALCGDSEMGVLPAPEAEALACFQTLLPSLKPAALAMLRSLAALRPSSDTAQVRRLHKFRLPRRP
jgi:transcriptional regulator with XRE-family HTH domain